MKKLIVNKKYNNKKLNKFLQDSIPNLSTNLLYKTLRKKDIKVNGKRVNDNITIFENDVIEVYIADNLLDKNIPVNIIFEDDNILVVDKPAQIEVTGNNSLTSLIHKQYANCGYLPMPCHRLDRNTTGLVLFAKNKEALDILLDKFKNRQTWLLQKRLRYLILIFGVAQRKRQCNSMTVILIRLRMH